MAKRRDQTHKPLPVWRPYDWSVTDADHVSRLLATQHAKIAQLLEIDPKAVEGRRFFSKAERKALTAFAGPVEMMTAIRHGGDVEFVPTIDVALEEIAFACLDCCAAILNEQSLASSATLYRSLEQIAGRENITENEIEDLDPIVRSLIASHYPVDRKQFAPGSVQARHVRKGAQAALKSLEPPERGRPKGTRTQLEPFIQNLIGIFDSWAKKPAARSVKVDREGGSFKEQGRFLEFCEIVFEAMPDWAQPKLLKSGGSLASAVKRALKAKRAGKPRTSAPN